MSLALLALAALLNTPPATDADSLIGRVTDGRGRPLAHALVRIPQLRRLAETDASGRFRFADLPRGRWTLSVTDIGYAPGSTSVDFGSSTSGFEIRLTEAPVELPALVSTGTPDPTTPLTTPLSSATMESDRLRRNQSVSIARAIEDLPGVRSVTTGSQIAKPLIRGLSGQRVLVLDGGHRLEDYSWSDEDGPSLDARLAGRVEVIRGPTSLLYGADALGGVVNAVPDPLPESGPMGNSWHRISVEQSVASNNAETGTTLRYERGSASHGFRANVVGRRAASLHTPDGELDNTGFGAVNGDLAWGSRGSKGSFTIRGAHYGGEFRLLEATGPAPAIRLRNEPQEEGPVRKARDERLQLDALRLAGAWRLEANAQFQQHSLVEVSDDANPTAGAGKETVAFDLLLNTLTAGLTAHRAIAGHLLTTVGVSALHQTNDTRGPIALVPAGTTNNAAAFAVVEHRTTRWSLLAGVRGDRSSLDAEANSSLSLGAEHRTFHAVTGNFGLLFRPVDGWSISANAGRGWRAPNLFELYSNGPKLSEARYEIGEPSLATEVGTNIEASIRWQRPRLRGELTGYRNSIDNYIYISPTGANAGGLAVYRYRQTDARLTGGEASLEVDPIASITVRARVDGVRALDRTNEAPLPLTPPIRTLVGVEWHAPAFGWAGRAHVGADLIGVARQDRLGTYDLPTAGYSLLEISAGFDRAVLGRSLAMELTIHNATNASYRDFLSRYKAFALNPGRDIMLRVSTTL
ncbi:MAG: TonB-dependent receptor [Gemmatimonadales bacterium]